MKRCPLLWPWFLVILSPILLHANPTLELDKRQDDTVLVVSGSGKPREATVTSVKGKAEYAAPGKTQYAAIEQGQKLPVGAKVRTGKDGEVILVPMPGTLLNIAPGTDLELTELAFTKADNQVTRRKALINLKNGEVTAALEKLDPKTTDFQVKMPQGVAAARGTIFSVKIENGKAVVTVASGVVSVTDNDGKSVRVTPGNAGTLSPGSNPSSGPADPNDLKDATNNASGLGSASDAPNSQAVQSYTLTSNPVTDTTLTIDGVEYHVRFGPGTNPGDLIIVLEPKAGQTVDVGGNRLPATTITMDANSTTVITLNDETGKIAIENQSTGTKKVNVNGTAVPVGGAVGLNGNGTLSNLTPGQGVQTFLNTQSTPSNIAPIPGSGNNMYSHFSINLNPEASTPFLPGQ